MSLDVRAWTRLSHDVVLGVIKGFHATCEGQLRVLHTRDVSIGSAGVSLRAAGPGNVQCGQQAHLFQPLSAASKRIQGLHVKHFMPQPSQAQISCKQHVGASIKSELRTHDTSAYIYSGLQKLCLRQWLTLFIFVLVQAAAASYHTPSHSAQLQTTDTEDGSSATDVPALGLPDYGVRKRRLALPPGADVPPRVQRAAMQSVAQRHLVRLPSLLQRPLLQLLQLRPPELTYATQQHRQGLLPPPPPLTSLRVPRPQVHTVRSPILRCLLLPPPLSCVPQQRRHPVVLHPDLLGMIKNRPATPLTAEAADFHQRLNVLLNHQADQQYALRRVCGANRAALLRRQERERTAAAAAAPGSVDAPLLLQQRRELQRYDAAVAGNAGRMLLRHERELALAVLNENAPIAEWHALWRYFRDSAAAASDDKRSRGFFEKRIEKVNVR
ncbi:hypothetical protein JKP88DRAFT_253604 [Tribonema minus]|uniref:Uncharacterized protein n=1 Tax=Tribonema minus TaxID=303371 RepID=A0A835ZB97_9STRA|nr:hypothetical protein JKP88DRAFT_253604 [Tribonema minus]